MTETPFRVAATVGHDGNVVYLNKWLAKGYAIERVDRLTVADCDRLIYILVKDGQSAEARARRDRAAQTNASKER
jgi:hypothetical protein